MRSTESLRQRSGRRIWHLLAPCLASPKRTLSVARRFYLYGLCAQGAYSDTFLTQGQRCGVLHVSASNLDDIAPFFRFLSVASRSAFIAGMSRSFTLTAAAMHIVDGNKSFDDCAMLT
jgi:hypothetical protein